MNQFKCDHCVNTAETSTEDLAEVGPPMCCDCDRVMSPVDAPTPTESVNSTTIKKITIGFVTQTYNEGGTFLGQEFTASDEVSYEDINNEPTDEPDDEQYAGFDMVQPMLITDKRTLDQVLDAFASSSQTKGAIVERVHNVLTDPNHQNDNITQNDLIRLVAEEFREAAETLYQATNR